MAEKIKTVRGMNDLLPPESATWHYFEERCKETFERSGYDEIRTPICESTALFSRGIGEATDIVEKEMYTFPDRKGRMLTLRPEMTASCARAYIQHGVYRKEPVTRWYYAGPMFRYERAQTGRYRQFYQIGCEAYGIESSTVDAEQIAMLHHLYQSLGVKNLDVRINSVGNKDDRPKYRQALLEALTPYKDELCSDCQRRLQENPLRILDCKVPRCGELSKDAPIILDHLGEESIQKFELLKSSLTTMEIPFTVDPRIVRGLDYYTGAVFEMIGTSKRLGSHSTLVAGGRYDGLIESLGGPATPAVGFALGVERGILSLVEESHQKTPDVYIASADTETRLVALGLSHKLQKAGLRVEIEHRQASFKSQFKRADKLGARFVLSLGTDEVASQQVRVKNMSERKEDIVKQADIVAFLVAAQNKA